MHYGVILGETPVYFMAYVGGSYLETGASQDSYLVDMP